MLFEDIKNVTSLPEYKEYIKALKNENEENKKKTFKKLKEAIDKRRGKKITSKMHQVETKPADKLWKKQEDESEKVYKKYNKLLDNFFINKEGNYNDIISRREAELDKVWKEYSPSKKDEKKAFKKGEEAKEIYLNRFNRKQLLKKYTEGEKRELEKNHKKHEIKKKLYEKYYDDDKLFKDTYNKLKEISGKKFDLKLFDKYKITYHFTLYHSVYTGFTDRNIYLGGVWWKINDAENLEDSEWEKIDKYLRKNIFNIFCKKVNLNKKNLDGDTGTLDHDGCFIHYRIPREDWEKIDPHLAASEGTKNKKDYNKRYKELLGKL